MRETQSEKKDYGLGIGIALVLCSLCMLVFPKYIGMPDIGSWIFYAVGFVLLLIGILGTCVEVFRR